MTAQLTAYASAIGGPPRTIAPGPSSPRIHAGPKWSLADPVDCLVSTFKTAGRHPWRFRWATQRIFPCSAPMAGQGSRAIVGRWRSRAETQDSDKPFEHVSWSSLRRLGGHEHGAKRHLRAWYSLTCLSRV